MTRIKEFIATITRRPSCMARVNWAEETSRFSYKRIRAIIVGLEDDTLCMKAKEYIVKAWCKQTGRNREEIEARLKSCLDERQEILRLKRYEETTNATPLLDENEYQRLKEENERLKQELAKYESDPENAIATARIDGIRSVVEQLIIYAEKFPSNQNDKAEVIKEALLAKSFNGHIPSEALTPEWKERLNNLGRKEIGVSFQGESMFKITGNDQVHIGGK